MSGITDKEKTEFIEARGWARHNAEPSLWANYGLYWRSLEDAYKYETGNGHNEPSEPIPPAGYPYAEPAPKTAFECKAIRWLELREALELSKHDFSLACIDLNQHRQQFNWQDTPVVVHWRGSLYVIRFTMENGAPAIEARLATTPEGIEGKDEPPY